MPAVFCDINPISSKTVNKIIDFSNAKGYSLTHKYLALLVLKNKQCIDSEGLSVINPITNRALMKMEEKIFLENTINSFNDLYAERVAFLHFGKRISPFDVHFMNVIINNQEKTGGWKTKDLDEFFGKNENPHTTILAVYSLASYTKTCPFSK